MPNIYLPGAIWRRLVSCDGFGCFVRCDREEARVDAVLRTLQKHLRCTHCRSTCAAHIALLLQRFTRLDRIELLAGDEGEIWTDSAFLAISYHPHNGISFGGTKLG